VDSGRVAVQDSIAELAAGGEQTAFDVGMERDADPLGLGGSGLDCSVFADEPEGALVDARGHEDRLVAETRQCRVPGLVAAVAALTILPMVIAYVVLLVLHANHPSRHCSASWSSRDGRGLRSTPPESRRSRRSARAGERRVPNHRHRVTRLRLIVGGTERHAAREIVGLVCAGGRREHGDRLGVSSLFSSRGTSIGILLGWQLALMPVLIAIGPLGRLRDGLFYAATDRLQPAALLDGPPPVTMSVATAVVVLVAWTVVQLALGSWRTLTRDA